MLQTKPAKSSSLPFAPDRDWETRRKFMETMDKKIKEGGQPGWDAGLSFGDS